MKEIFASISKLTCIGSFLMVAFDLGTRIGSMVKPKSKKG